LFPLLSLVKASDPMITRCKCLYPRHDSAQRLDGSWLVTLVLTQWRAEVWGCSGRLLDCMHPYQNLVSSSGVWWSLLLD